MLLINKASVLSTQNHRPLRDVIKDEPFDKLESSIFQEKF